MKRKKCPLFELCTKLREGDTETGLGLDKTTCYCSSWLLDNKKHCKNYHPELISQPNKKITKRKKTYKELRKEMRRN